MDTITDFGSLSVYYLGHKKETRGKLYEAVLYDNRSIDYSDTYLSLMLLRLFVRLTTQSNPESALYGVMLMNILAVSEKRLPMPELDGKMP